MPKDKICHTRNVKKEPREVGFQALIHYRVLGTEKAKSHDHEENFNTCLIPVWIPEFIHLRVELEDNCRPFPLRISFKIALNILRRPKTWCFISYFCRNFRWRRQGIYLKVTNCKPQMQHGQHKTKQPLSHLRPAYSMKRAEEEDRQPETVFEKPTNSKGSAHKHAAARHLHS